MYFLFFFFKQKTAYEMRISDWSSDVCSSDLLGAVEGTGERRHVGNLAVLRLGLVLADDGIVVALAVLVLHGHAGAESNLVVRLLGRIDDARLAQALLPLAPFLLDEHGSAPCRERECQFG